MAEYRILQTAEWPGAVELWTRVFQLNAPFFTTLLEGGGPEDNVSVAALEDGRVVSSVHVFMRSIRDREGRALKVGGIGSVSTDPEHRKQGHSGRLLEMAVEAMEREGCVWSLLGTGVNDHYARYGWRTVSTSERWGELREAPGPLTPSPSPPESGRQTTLDEPSLRPSSRRTLPEGRGEIVELTPDDATLGVMAALYDTDTKVRPMATVRTTQAWRTAVRFRLLGRTLILGAYDGEQLAAYVVVRKPGGTWTFTEAAGDPSRLPELFAAAAQRLRVKVEYQVQASMPEGSGMDAFAAIVDQVRIGEDRGVMLRPIADRISWSDLLALYGDPRGRHGDLDAF